MEADLRRQAVERAYRDHADDVYRVAFAILRDGDLALDVSQETFARAFERWDQYDSARPLRHWLHGIASHAALDLLRRRRVRTNWSGVAEIPVADPETADPASQVVRRQFVAETLARLPPLPRAALVLRHFYGYDYEQIAGLLRTTPGNVGSVLSRAHALLRARLTDAERAAEQPALDDRIRETARRQWR